ncbi:hypothetical protein ABQJ54_02135 [Rhodanobacter sp. Si-c]|uniref:SMODS-associating 2TM beta-strand rich effector domain-containing protein n=1 Tax=Rhodanobacter lycopersici TaxID=3162487 RepID=A0ABV3Q9Q5_9GAMM
MMKDAKHEDVRPSKLVSRLLVAASFARHCFRFAATDALSAAFGWATVINGAALVYLAGRAGIAINSSQGWPSILLYAAGCFLVGLVIAFFINLVLVAPGKTHRLMWPLVLHISGDDRSPDYVFHEIARGFNSTVKVTNRSHEYLLDCAAHILGVTLPAGEKHDRFVEKFDLPPQSTKNVYVAYWFARDVEPSDDKEINLCGPVGAGFGGNRLSVPADGAELTVRIQAPGKETKCIRCRVWVDRGSRKLMTSHLPLGNARVPG